MLTAEQYIAARYPAADSSRVSALIPIAEETLSNNRYKDKYGIAIGLLVLHWITKEEIANSSSDTGIDGNSGTVTGSIASEKEGDLAISYNSSKEDAGTPTNGDSVYSDWNTTSWGLELIQLTKACCFGVGIA